MRSRSRVIVPRRAVVAGATVQERNTDMTSPDADPSSNRPAAPPTRRPLAIAAIMTALIGAFYLLREHWGHVAGMWPYLLPLACPAMHLFHGHGGHGHPAGHSQPADRPTTKEE
jgi:hypothetical protein